MPILHAILLGLVQGLTEFLPVSSSGHLSLVPWLFGWDDFGGEPALEDAFDVALHLGTLVGAVAYLWDDVVRYLGASLRWLRSGGRPEGDARTACLLVTTALPTAALGLIVLVVAGDLGDRTWLLAACLVAFGVVMWWVDRRAGAGGMPLAELSFGRAVWLGVAQGLAFQPGVSRSGVVLTVARGMGVERSEAARLSFLMALPVVLGAGLVSMGGLTIPTGWWASFLAGTLASALSGWVAVHVLLRVVARGGLGGFAAYRVVVGLAVLTLIVAGVR
ncbi:MAG: undecaprenyl-diphosphate phosphatase [Actinomycetota bacterium]|nr:undecaprenyl-diphosphate phosphatase [Actinomycetota bacterium]